MGDFDGSSGPVSNASNSAMVHDTWKKTDKPEPIMVNLVRYDDHSLLSKMSKSLTPDIGPLAFKRHRKRDQTRRQDFQTSGPQDLKLPSATVRAIFQHRPLQHCTTRTLTHRPSAAISP